MKISVWYFTTMLSSNQKACLILGLQLTQLSRWKDSISDCKYCFPEPANTFTFTQSWTESCNFCLEEKSRVCRCKLVNKVGNCELSPILSKIFLYNPSKFYRITDNTMSYMNYTVNWQCIFLLALNPKFISVKLHTIIVILTIFQVRYWLQCILFFFAINLQSIVSWRRSKWLSCLRHYGYKCQCWPQTGSQSRPLTNLRLPSCHPDGWGKPAGDSTKLTWKVLGLS